MNQRVVGGVHQEERHADLHATQEHRQPDEPAHTPPPSQWRSAALVMLALALLAAERRRRVTHVVEEMRAALLLVVFLHRAVAVKFPAAQQEHQAKNKSSGSEAPPTRPSPHDAVVYLHQRRGCAQPAQVAIADTAGVPAEQTAPVRQTSQTEIRREGSRRVHRRVHRRAENVHFTSAFIRLHGQKL